MVINIATRPAVTAARHELATAARQGEKNEGRAPEIGLGQIDIRGRDARKSVIRVMTIIEGKWVQI